MKKNGNELFKCFFKMEMNYLSVGSWAQIIQLGFGL